MGRLKPLWFSLFTLTLQTSALLVFIFPIPVFAETVIPTGSNLSWNQTWTKEGSPYIIQGNVYVRFGSLAINPGTVVKVMNGAVVTLHADVHVTIAGTPEEPVTFTSFKDDSVSGDTNGDGSSSVPSPGDWGYVSIGGGGTNNNMQVQHLKVRYGGAIPVTYGSIYVGLFTASPALLLDFPWFSGNPGVGYAVDTVEVSHSADTGLLLNVGTNHSVVVSSSSFFNNHAYGVQKVRLFDSRGRDQTGTLDLSGNWWGSPTGPYHETLNPTGEGNAIAGTKLALASWLSENPFPDSLYSECCSSVVFLPGIKGSNLKNGNDTLWPPSLVSFDDDILKLALNEDGTSVNPVQVDGVLENFYIASIYSGFTDFLESLETQEVIQDWLPVPYDWRYGPEKILADGVQTPTGIFHVIDEIEELALERSQTGKVTIVAHSMGGLLGKAIIKTFEEQGKGDLIDSFVMVGSPQLGTPQAVAGLLHGDDEGIGLGSLYYVVNPASSRTVSQNFQSAYNLLPSRVYFEATDDPVITFNENADFTEPWRNFWGTEGIQEYIDFFGFATGAGVLREDPSINELRVPEILRSDLMTAADDFHNEYDNYEPPSHVRVVQVAGWGLKTTKGVEYKNSHFLPGYKTIKTREGDKSVVYPSVLLGTGEKFFFNVFDYNESLSADISHRDLLSAEGVKDLVKKVIQKNDVVNIPFVSVGKPEISETEDQLIVSTHSPVILGVYDAYGNFTGIDQGQDLNVQALLITQNIPGSEFLVSGDSQSIYLPKEGQYSFVYKGIGEGPTTVEIGVFSNDAETTLQSFIDLPTLAGTEVVFELDSNNPENTELHLDKNGDDVVDYIITPSNTGETIFPKAPLSITAHSQKITLGDSLPEFSYEISGFVANETLEMSDVTGEPECLTTANANSPAGVYAITCTVGTLNSDYYRFENFIAGQLKIEYQWKGFKQPIDDPISQPGVTPSIFKAGSTVPVKFSLFDTDENIVEASVAPEWLPPIKGTALVGGVDEPVSYESATSGNLFKYDPESKQYIYNWKTKGLASGYWYHVFVRLDDGSVRTVKVGLK